MFPKSAFWSKKHRDEVKRLTDQRSKYCDNQESFENNLVVLTFFRDMVINNGYSRHLNRFLGSNSQG